MPSLNSRSRAARLETKPGTLQSRAMADLQFIRETMASAAAYTAFSGWGLLAVGCGALATGVIASREATLRGNLAVWLVDGIASFCIGAIASTIKARASAQPLFAGPIRKFSLSFAPAILVGAVLSFAMIDSAAASFLPATWLLLYGAGLIAAGTQSVWVIPVMGIAFFAVGVVSLLAPLAWANTLLTLAFAGFNAFFGIVIARRHGG